METQANAKMIKEHDRLMELFKDADESQKALADGLIWEAAKMRCQMDDMNDLVDRSGYVLFSKVNPARQKELPVSRALTKLRANYVAYIQRIRSLMNVETEDEYDDLSEYE